MAIPVTNIPVLTGEVAERFIEQCEYNSQHLAGSEWSQEKEDEFNDWEEKNRAWVEEYLKNLEQNL